MKRKREMSAWLFMVNALYWAANANNKIDDGVFSLVTPSKKPYFWRYSFLAQEGMKKEFPSLLMWTDRRSLESAIDDVLIKKDYDIIYISAVNKSIINDINEGLGKKISKRLPHIFIEAYKKTKNEPQ